MDAALLAKQSWGTGLVIAGVQLLLMVMACYLRLVVEMVRRREYTLGILFAGLFLLIGGGWAVGVLVGLPVGWRNATRWNLRGWMTFWTLALVLGLVNVGAGLVLLQLPVEQWREWFD
jgi:hypothetical protein